MGQELPAQRSRQPRSTSSVLTQLVAVRNVPPEAEDFARLGNVRVAGGCALGSWQRGLIGRITRPATGNPPAREAALAVAPSTKSKERPVRA
jgi:hypothetical protein